MESAECGPCLGTSYIKMFQNNNKQKERKLDADQTKYVMAKFCCRPLVCDPSWRQRKREARYMVVTGDRGQLTAADGQGLEVGTEEGTLALLGACPDHLSLRFFFCKIGIKNKQPSHSCCKE